MKLGNYVNVRTGKLDANASVQNGKYPFFTCSKETLKINDYAFDCECVLLAGNGEINAKYYSGKFNAYQRTYIIESKDKSILSVKFLYFYFLWYISILKKDMIGGVIKYIRLNNITDAKIDLPSIEDQNKFVEQLEQLLSCLDNRNKQLSLLDELIKSRFIEMFGDDLAGQTNRLGDLCEVITKGTTPTTLGFDFVDEGINFVKIECITEGYEFLIDKMLHITNECDEKLKRSRLKENDVLFSIAGAIGRTAIVSKEILPANTNQALAIIRLKENSGLNVNFLNEMLHTDLINKQVDGKKSGVAQTNLSLTDIGNFNVIVPSMDKQIDFSKFKELIDNSKSIIKKQIDLLQELLDKKMDEYFNV